MRQAIWLVALGLVWSLFAGACLAVATPSQGLDILNDTFLATAPVIPVPWLGTWDLNRNHTATLPDSPVDLTQVNNGQNHLVTTRPNYNGDSTSINWEYGPAQEFDFPSPRASKSPRSPTSRLATKATRFRRTRITPPTCAYSCPAMPVAKPS